MSDDLSVEQVEAIFAEMARNLFGTRVNVVTRRHAPPVGAGRGAGQALVINDWIWVYRRTPPPDGWSVQVLLPADPPFPLTMPCIKQLNGTVVTKPNVGDVLMVAVLHLTHAAFHERLRHLTASWGNVVPEVAQVQAHET